MISELRSVFFFSPAVAVLSVFFLPRLRLYFEKQLCLRIFHSPCSKNSSISSGASFGLTQFPRVSRDFSFIGLPHADNAPGTAARRSHYDHHAFVQDSDSDVPCSAVIAYGILPEHGNKSAKHFLDP